MDRWADGQMGRSVAIVDLLEAEAAPLAGRGGKEMSLVKLDVLHGVAQAQLVDTGAAGLVAVDHHNRKVIYELLSICEVSVVGFLRTIKDQI